MSDRISNRPAPPRPDRPRPEPDEDAPPRRATLSVWSSEHAGQFILKGVSIGGGLGGLGLVFAKGLGFPLWLVLAAAPVGFVLGAAVGVVLAAGSIREKIGRGVRSSGRDLPRCQVEASPRPARPSLPRTAIRQGPEDRPPFPAAPPRHVSRLVPQRGRVQAVALSQDGGLALSAGDDRAVSLWDVQTGFELLAFHGFGGAIRSVAFSPDGRLVAACGEDNRGGKNEAMRGAVRIWDAQTGQELRRFEIQGYLWSLAFLPDGQHLALGGIDYLRLWEIDGPSPVAMVGLKRGIGSFEEVRAVAVSADGQLAVAGCHLSRDARLVNLDQGIELRTLTGHSMSFGFFRTAGVVAAAFSPDGLRVLTGSWDQTARVWNLAGKGLVRFDGHRGWWGWRAVVGVGWLDDHRALSASENGWLCVWDAATGRELARYHHGAGVTSLAATPDGRLALTGGRDGVVRVWDV